jgi:hypothetical protein
MVTGISNEIPLCNDWDPDNLKSPAKPIIPNPVELPASKPIATARQMVVEIPATVTGCTDSFIDNLNGVFYIFPSTDKKTPILSHLPFTQPASHTWEPRNQYNSIGTFPTQN